MKVLQETQKSPFYIEELDSKITDWKAKEAENINYTLYIAYHNSKQKGLNLIDFNDIIWTNDVEAIVKTLRENEIKAFTVSCQFCDLINRLADFEQLGCRVTGLVNVKTTRLNFDGNPMQFPALKVAL